MSKSHPLTNMIFAFINLARLRIVGMVAIACAIGFILAGGDIFSLRFVCTLLGTALLSSGSCALNCYMERDLDALMERTCQRPLPAKIISPASALIFGITLIASGCILLVWKINLLACFLALLAVFIYLAIYTPAKRWTWLNTSIGALPGAIPPLIGWASERGQIDTGGWILFSMLFLWQHTHFLPIAWLYRQDYQKAGFRMLPVLEIDGKKTFRLTVITAACLLPISLLLCRSLSENLAYFLATALSGVILLAAGLYLARKPSRAAAQAVFFLSLFYLPMILAAVVADHYGAQLTGHWHQLLETVGRWT